MRHGSIWSLWALTLAACPPGGSDTNESDADTDADGDADTDADADTDVEPASAVIGADGGTLSSGGIVVTVPAGALTSDVTLTITPTDPFEFEGATVIGPAVELGPSGTTFAVPVRVEVPYDTTVETTPADIAVAHGNDDGTVSMVPPVFVADGRAIIETTSFSPYEAIDRLGIALLNGPPERRSWADPKEVPPRGGTTLHVVCPPGTQSARWSVLGHGGHLSYAPMERVGTTDEYTHTFADGAGPEVSTDYQFACQTGPSSGRLESTRVTVYADQPVVAPKLEVRTFQLFPVGGAAILAYATEGDTASCAAGTVAPPIAATDVIPGEGGRLLFGLTDGVRGFVTCTNSSATLTAQAAHTLPARPAIATFDVQRDLTSPLLLHVTVSATHTNRCEVQPGWGSIASPFEHSQWDMYDDGSITEYTLTCEGPDGNVVRVAEVGASPAPTVAASAGGFGAVSWFVNDAVNCSLDGTPNLAPIHTEYVAEGDHVLTCTSASGAQVTTTITAE